MTPTITLRVVASGVRSILPSEMGWDKTRGGMPKRTHAPAIPQRYDAEAIVLDFVQPVRADRRLFGWGWQARLDEADRVAATL